jgi:hypothetical protein
MRRIMTRIVIAVLILSSPGLSQAQQSRLAAFTLQCFVPTTRGYHTRATLVGRFTLENRTVWTVASCADGPSPARWPEFSWEDGAVQAVDLWVETALEDPAYQLVRATSCAISTGNGFFSGRCIADESLGGQVNILVSIAASAP